MQAQSWKRSSGNSIPKTCSIAGGLCTLGCEMHNAENRRPNGSALSEEDGNSAGRNPGAGIDYDLFLDCVHCGLCTAACPTFAELGDENDSPRGRIYLMRAVTDGRLEMTHEVRRHLD